MHAQAAQVLIPADSKTVTWNWVDAFACEVKTRSATPAEARAALCRVAQTENAAFTNSSRPCFEPFGCLENPKPPPPVSSPSS